MPPPPQVKTVTWSPVSSPKASSSAGRSREAVNGVGAAPVACSAHPVVYRQAVRPENYFFTCAGIVFFALGPVDDNAAAGAANVWWVAERLHADPCALAVINAHAMACGRVLLVIVGCAAGCPPPPVMPGGICGKIYRRPTWIR
jgi:hypothetical protein